MAEIWTTKIVEVATPRGVRYQGVCYVGEGTPTYGKLPRNADVRYRTRLLKSHIEAREQARSRTIHHNLWHDGTTPLKTMELHTWRDCPERRGPVVDGEQFAVGYTAHAARYEKATR